jgi:hypothetical protein
VVVETTAGVGEVDLVATTGEEEVDVEISVATVEG